MRSEIDFLF